MTAPLTPPDSDLQDFPFMPLHVARLRDSDLAATASPEACWYAVLLWAASWHQLPAGSLPDDDMVLTKLIGLGRDVRTFRKHKAAALHGFIKCSDGRLYHPVVAEQVLEAWESKRQQRWRTECARIKKYNQRHGTTIPQPTYEEFIGGPPNVPDPSPEIVPEDTGESPSGQTLQGTGTGTGRLFEEADASLAAGESSEASPTYPPLFEEAWAAYPHVKGRSSKKLSLVQWKRLPPTTRGALPAAVKRYAAEGKEPRMEGGAAAMERWLRDERYADWITLAAAGPLGQDWPDSRWSAAISLWRRDGSWDERLGPTPGAPGCLAPPHLVVQPAASA